MSIEASQAVWKHSKHKSGGLLVLLAIADHVNEEKGGIAWPAVSTIAQKTRMSVRNVQRWLNALQRTGELEVQRNKGRCGSNVYKICVPATEPGDHDASGTDDAGVAEPVTQVSPSSGTGATQSVSESLIESTPVVPKGDDTDFWIKVCFDCFEQTVHPVRAHVLRALSVAIPALNKNYADSLIEFYQATLFESKQPLYSSRRHSPERLILDLPRQLALAVEECPPPPPPKPPPEYSFTIEEVCEYLREQYRDLRLPHSLAELDTWRFDSIRSQILEAMRMKNKKQVP